MASFWDTVDLFTDSKEQLKIKLYRRKSNYYEEKSIALTNLMETIRKDIASVTNNYEFRSIGDLGSEDHVMKYRYNLTEQNFQKKVQSLIDHYNDCYSQALIKRDQATELFDYYYRKGLD